jgi:hypothetical protein
MPRVSAAVVVAFVMFTAPALARQQPPASLELDGGVSLPLAGDADRAQLLGSVEFYRLSIYAQGSLRDVDALSSADAPKAMRIDVRYAPTLQQSITFDWQRELIPALEGPAITALRRIFSPLRRGDVVRIEYTRDKGTTVRVNRDVAVSRGSHELMLAFLDHWIGQRPVSEQMKAALLR